MGSRPGRQLINWNRTPGLRIAKMLAWAIKQHEGLGKYDLWHRFEVLYPLVVEMVLNEKGITFEMLRDNTLEMQDKKITPNKLDQRADKAERYSEFNASKDVVLQAYKVIVNSNSHNLLDERRCFTNEEVTFAIERQNHKCFACEAPLNSLNLPVGDHIIPYSRGGKTHQDNCAALCVSCNQRKGRMDLIQFLKKIGMDSARGRKSIFGGDK